MTNKNFPGTRQILTAIVLLFAFLSLALPRLGHAQTTITAAIPSFDATNIQAFSVNGDAARVGSVLRLTEDENNEAGSAFWNTRINLANDRSFSAYFTFRIYDNLTTGADGIVFVLQPNSNNAGGIGQGIGYDGITNSIGIEFDTYDNGVGLGDPNGNHIAVDLDGDVENPIASVNVSSINGAWELDDGTVYHAWIDYTGSTDTLEVRLNNSNTRPGSAALSTTINLANEFAADVFVGFTSATGGDASKHEIRSFYFNSNIVSGGIDPQNVSYQSAPYSVALSRSPTAIGANGTSTSTITATVTDVGGSPLSGETITFQTSSGALSGGGTAVTNGSGVATITLTSSSTVGTATVRGTAVGGNYGETTVAFSPIITPSVVGNGSISPSTATTVTSGGTQAFTITPDAGHSVTSVGGTCGGSLTGLSYTTNAITAHCTVIANFAATTVTLGVNNPTIAEAGGVATFTATLNGPSASTVTVDLGYSGTATGLGVDYAHTGTQIAISSGSTTGLRFVTAAQDTLDENNETVIVDITGVTNGSESGTQQATTTITDDDSPPSVTIDASPSSISENAGVSTITATLSAVSGLNVTVNLSYTGTATGSGTDYTASSTQIVIPAGNPTGTATITAAADLIDESGETVIIDVASVTNGTESGTQQETVTILNDESSIAFTLSSPLQAAWNSNFNQRNIITLRNVGSASLNVSLTLRDFNGNAANPYNLVLAAKEQQDLILNNLDGFNPESYGIVKIEFSGSGKLDGHMAYYRMAPDDTHFEFGFLIPFANAVTGTTYETFNTIQPNLHPDNADGGLIHWLQIMNPNLGYDREFTVNLYTYDGELVSTQELSVPTNGRRDVQAGHEDPGMGKVGLVEIVPAESGVPYSASLYHYASNDPLGTEPQSFSFASGAYSRAASNRVQYVPVSQGRDAKNWVVIANPGSSTATAQVKILSNLSGEVYDETVQIAAKDQLHIPASSSLPEGESGILTVTPSSGSVIAKSMTYHFDADLKVTAASTQIGRGQHAGPIYSSYNSFFGMLNWMRLYNISGSNVTANVEAFDMSGASLGTKVVSIAANSGYDMELALSLDFSIPNNAYGSFSVTPSSNTALIGEVGQFSGEGYDGLVDFVGLLPLR